MGGVDGRPAAASRIQDSLTGFIVCVGSHAGALFLVQHMLAQVRHPKQLLQFTQLMWSRGSNECQTFLERASKQRKCADRFEPTRILMTSFAGVRR